MTPTASEARRHVTASTSSCLLARVSPPAPTTPLASAGGGFSLQDRIDALQARADALRGKPGYQVALERLRNAKLAALAGGQA